jgi:hypothetical protein
MNTVLILLATLLGVAAGALLSWRLRQGQQARQDAELARLRDAATIAWHGEFKDRGAAAAPAAPIDIDKPADDKSLDAGIKGLR